MIGEVPALPPGTASGTFEAPVAARCVLLNPLEPVRG